MPREHPIQNRFLRIVLLVAGVPAILIAFVAFTDTPQSKPRAGDSSVQPTVAAGDGVRKISGDGTSLHFQTSHRTRSNDAPLSPPLPLFLSAVNYDTGAAGARSVAVADLNHDGHPDVVVANVNGLGVLLGNGGGTLRAVVTYDSGGNFATDVKIADLNRDGRPDIVVANECGDARCTYSTVGVLLGNGDGTFQPVVIYDPAGFTTYSIAVADVNGDGHLDLLVSNCGTTGCSTLIRGTVAILLGNGDGTFQPAVAYDSGGYESLSVTVADINGDGKPDLVVANLCAQFNDIGFGEGAVAVLLGNGDGTFQSALTFDPLANDSEFAVARDVNGDGRPDLLVSNCMPSDRAVCGIQPGVISVLLGNGDGTFQPAKTYQTAGDFADRLSVADLNGDRKLDLAVATGEGVEVWLGNGDGTFHAQKSYISEGSRAVVVADMNRNGNPDLVSTVSSGVAVLLHVGNQATTTTLTSAPNPSVYGQVTFAAAVHSGSGTPTGTVVLFNKLSSVGSATLVNGSTTLPGDGAGAGSDSMTAEYQGSVQYKPSLSPVLTQAVTKAATTSAVKPSANPWVVGKYIIYSVTVTGQYGGPVTGSVICLDNGSALQTVKGHPWEFHKKYTTIGTHSIACTYFGDANNVGSTAPTLTEQILYPTTTVLTTSGSPSHVGQPVTFTASVSSPFGAISDGELVAFTYGVKNLGTAPLSHGSAALTTSSLPKGTYTVKGTYHGDMAFHTSVGKVSQEVDP